MIFVAHFVILFSCIFLQVFCPCALWCLCALKSFTFRLFFVHMVLAVLFLVMWPFLVSVFSFFLLFFSCCNVDILLVLLLFFYSCCFVVTAVVAYGVFFVLSRSRLCRTIRYLISVTPTCPNSTPFTFMSAVSLPVHVSIFTCPACL